MPVKMGGEEKVAHAWLGWGLANPLHHVILLQEIPGASALHACEVSAGHPLQTKLGEQLLRGWSEGPFQHILPEAVKCRQAGGLLQKFWRRIKTRQSM